MTHPLADADHRERARRAELGEQIRRQSQWVHGRLEFLAAVAELRALVEVAETEAARNAERADPAPAKPADFEFLVHMTSIWALVIGCLATALAFAAWGVVGGGAVAAAQIAAAAVLRRRGLDKLWSRLWLAGVAAGLVLRLVS